MWTIAVHAGAGQVKRKGWKAGAERERLEGLRRALRAGAAVLERDGDALEAVTAAVEAMEDHPGFNAGKGSVFTADGRHEMDACVMDGARRCGAVTCATGVRHPVRAARLVLEKSPHVLLAGAAVEDLARREGLELVENAYFSTPERRSQWERLKDRGAPLVDHAAETADGLGTVGAVARDGAGRLAAATSTGGMSLKWSGRVGDTPVPGAGTWAEDGVCAVSATGWGERILCSALAHEVAARVRLAGEDLAAAARRSLERAEQSGLIAVGPTGPPVLEANTNLMLRGLWTPEGPRVAAWMDEDPA